WTRSQQDQAAYQAAADVRMVATASAPLPGWAAGSAIRALPGVTRAMPVERQPFAVSGTIRDGVLLAVDPATAATMLPSSAVRGADPALALGALAAARPTFAAVPLPGQPTVLRLSLRLMTTSGQDLEGASMTVQVVLRDHDGRFYRVVPNLEVPVDGAVHAVDVPLVGTLNGTALRPTYPLALEAVQVQSSLGPDVSGRAVLLGVSVLADPAGPATPVQLDPAPLAQALIPVGDGPPVTTDLWFAPDRGRTTLDAVVSQTLLDLTGSVVGDHVPISTSGGMALSLHIVGVTTLFPPLDPASPFVVVDEPTLDVERWVSTRDTANTAEWWLQVDPAAAATVAATLAQRPFAATQVVGRDALAHALLTDPVALGTVGALLLGAVAAIAFAAIGFVVSAIVSTTERTGELALLRALGLSARQLRAWLSLEDAALLLLGLLGGALLGLLMAWLVLPFTTLAANGGAPVPPPVVEVPWSVGAVLGLVAVALLVATVVIIARALPRIRLATVLRAGE
ncbi:MAG TPA: FtsX-like permease family protein, partial [Candidatus Sulfotelmatobacter sp.]|nr:FtsX-like permease family protein [Candidatus Sulfotelmatobacter sp.]